MPLIVPEKIVLMMTEKDPPAENPEMVTLSASALRSGSVPTVEV
jgi:hypothetical protein